MLTLVNEDCLKATGEFEMVFADPPDNIGLDYADHDDKLPDWKYRSILFDWIYAAINRAPIVWFSFNAQHTLTVADAVDSILKDHAGWEFKPCVQVFTFGQHNQKWLGNNHRPLWCIHKRDAVFYPDAIRVPSWRQLNGDSRADTRGRVPGDVFDMQYGKPEPGTVFDFPRVTGNSKQRCFWHPTQLHEELVERVIAFSTKPGDSVLDMFSGTGTCLRVCERIHRSCTAYEISKEYCENTADYLEMLTAGPLIWRKNYGQKESERNEEKDSQKESSEESAG